MTEISPNKKIRLKKRKKKPFPHTKSNADYFPTTAQQTVPDWIPAISNVKKDS